MPNLTYNIIVQKDRVGADYWEKIQKLTKAYEIQSSLIVCNTNRVTIVYFKDGSLEKKVFKGKPYSTIPAAVTAHEHGIPQTDVLRWVIAPPSVIDKVKEGLRNSGFFDGSKYHHVEVGTIYGNNAEPTSNGQAIITGKNQRYNAAGMAASTDRLAELLETARIQGIRTDPMPNLAELIERVPK